MAKFSDYAKSDDLDQEIDEARQDHQDRKDNPDSAVPDRFRGKSAEEIAQSYVELERRFSQQGNDLGTLRKTVDEFMALQLREAEAQQGQPEPEIVSLDDIYENPDEAMSRVVKREGRETNKRVEELEQELNALRQERNMSALNDRYEGWRDEVETPEFRDWLQSKQYRVRLAMAADQLGDMDAATELLEMYYDSKGAAASNSRAIDEASLERGGGIERIHSDQTFSRGELMSKRIAAKRGDQEADYWLRQNAEAIAIAYEQGNITD